MDNARVTFRQRKQETVEGRKVDAWADYYTAWADLPSQSMTERVEIQNRGLVDAVTLELRTCCRVEEIRRNQKQFRVMFRGVDYDLIGADYSRRRSGFIRFLASRAD